MRRTVLLAAVLAGGLLAPAAALGQAAPAGTLPVVPDPAECGIAPRDAEELRAPAATPVPTGGGATPQAAGGGPGAAVDAATEAFVAAAVREAVACGNAHGFPGVAALLSDAALAASGGAGALGFAPDDAAPAAAGRRSLLAVLDARYLGDGRVGAYAVVADPRRTPPATLFRLVLAEGAAGTGGSEQYLFLIDGVEADPFGFVADAAG